MTSHEQQLELFPLGVPSAPAPRRDAIGGVMVRLRHDQAMLAAIGALIGVAVIFAGGVERGKQLVRGEQLLLARAQVTAPDQPSVTGAKSAAAATPDMARAVQQARPTSDAARTSGSSSAAKSTAGKSSRYAIQVVTYSQPRLATQELQRLQAKGESAFLMKRAGRIVVYIGPFLSQAHASKKLTLLKNRYQDCFVKTL